MIAAHLQQVVSKFLAVDGGIPIRLHLAASLPMDPAVSRSTSRQRLLTETDPHGPVTSVIPRLVESLRAGPIKVALRNAEEEAP